jgi:hypothetical protein
VLVDQLSGRCEELHVEVDDSFEGEFLGREQVEEGVEAVALVEFSYFGYELVDHGEGGGGVGESNDHVPQIILQLQHFLLQALIRPLQLVAFLLPGGQLAHQNPEFPLKFFELRRITVADLVEFLLIFVVLEGEVVFVGPVFRGLAPAVRAEVHDSK